MNPCGFHPTRCSAPWCSPCNMLTSMLDQLASQYAGRARIVRVNIQDQPDLGRRYNARTVPMQLVSRGGQMHGHQVGAVGTQQLAQLIDRAL